MRRFFQVVLSRYTEEENSVTAETVPRPGNADMSWITNYCLKFNHDDYIAHRERTGDMVVLAQEVTADGSIAFQLSKKI